MSDTPLLLYLHAKDALKGGDRATAARLLAECFGAEVPTPVIENAVDKLLDHDSLPGEVALGLLAGEVRKRTTPAD